ncbi:hypothetical protein, partial [Bacillus safensis]|uniref:hypothetical protein n=1 Tax=Bacillus safensis TaxID=561879 RepID=UPI0005597854
RSAPVLALPTLQRLSITLKRRQMAKIKNILAFVTSQKERSQSFLFLFITDSLIFFLTVHAKTEPVSRS